MEHTVYVISVLLASFKSFSQQHFPFGVIFLSNCSVLTLGHIAESQLSENTVEVVLEVQETEWAEGHRPVATSGHLSSFPTVTSDCSHKKKKTALLPPATLTGWSL
jgi:hypothetical protein